MSKIGKQEIAVHYSGVLDALVLVYRICFF